MARRLACALPLTLVAALVAATTSPAASAEGVSSPGTGGATLLLPSGPTGGAAPGEVEPPTPTRTAPARPGRGARDVPRPYLRLYRAAARRHGVDWRVLAAIGKNESDHGRSAAAGVRSGLNFADCCAGPMQICAVASCGQVWQHYATDADGDGKRSIYAPADSIHAAAAIVADLQAIFGRNRPGYLLAAYNAGPAAVQRHRGVPDYPETRAYVARGLRYMKQITR